MKTFYQSIVNESPRLRRNQVWCHTCGRTQTVDSAHCLARGWPKCCEQTMSIDSPEERRQMEQASQSWKESESK